MKRVAVIVFILLTLYVSAYADPLNLEGIELDELKEWKKQIESRIAEIEMAKYLIEDTTGDAVGYSAGIAFLDGIVWMNSSELYYAFANQYGLEMGGYNGSELTGPSLTIGGVKADFAKRSFPTFYKVEFELNETGSLEPLVMAAKPY